MTNAPLAVTCWVCQQPIDGARVSKLRRDEPIHLHPACWEKIEAEQRAETERRLEEARKAIRRDFEYSAMHPELVQRVGGLPEFTFAQVDNDEFRRRSSRKIATAVERYDFRMNLMLSSATGRGKTGWLVARLKNLRNEAVANAKPSDGGPYMRGFALRFFFLTGYELASARRNWKLGEESPVIDLAKTVPILILDELGYEQLTELPFEVIDHRYRGQRVTVVTTGLKPAEFRSRYGDAAFRRIAESGAVIEDW